MINLNAEKDNKVYTVNGNVFKSNCFDVPCLDGLAFIWLLLNHCNVEVQSCCKVCECQNLSELKTGCYPQHNCRERTYPKTGFRTAFTA